MIVIRTNLTVEQCLERLRQGTGSDTVWIWGSVFDDYPVLSRIAGTEIRLRKNPSWHNSFAPRFVAQAFMTPCGTEIRGEFRRHPSVRVILWLWSLIGGLACGIVVVKLAVHRIGAFEKPWFELWLPPLGLLGVWLIYALGCLLGKHDEAVIRKFLTDTFPQAQN